MPHTRERESEQGRRDARYRNWDEYQKSSDDDSAVDPENAFRDLIQRDGTICDNCFLDRYEAVTHEWWRGSFGWLDYERWVPHPERSERVPADTTASGTRLACSECGHRVRSKQRPVPKHLIEEYAENISEALDKKGIDHQRDVLIQEVVARNTSDTQGRQDTDVFGPAVERAIRATPR